MSASTEGIGPLSVRYAAQLRELLYSQAAQRAAAEQEAARGSETAKKPKPASPQPSAPSSSSEQEPQATAQNVNLTA